MFAIKRVRAFEDMYWAGNSCCPMPKKPLRAMRSQVGKLYNLYFSICLSLFVFATRSCIPAWLGLPSGVLCSSHLAVASQCVWLDSQVMFCRRKQMLHVGGFNPEVPIMEDADLCLKLHFHGRCPAAYAGACELTESKAAITSWRSLLEVSKPLKEVGNI